MGWPIACFCSLVEASMVTRISAQLGPHRQVDQPGFSPLCARERRQMFSRWLMSASPT